MYALTEYANDTIKHVFEKQPLFILRPMFKGLLDCN